MKISYYELDKEGHPGHYIKSILINKPYFVNETYYEKDIHGFEGKKFEILGLSEEQVQRYCTHYEFDAPNEQHCYEFTLVALQPFAVLVYEPDPYQPWKHHLKNAVVSSYPRRHRKFPVIEGVEYIYNKASKQSFVKFEQLAQLCGVSMEELWRFYFRLQGIGAWCENDTTLKVTIDIPTHAEVHRVRQDLLIEPKEYKDVEVGDSGYGPYWERRWKGEFIQTKFEELYVPERWAHWVYYLEKFNHRALLRECLGCEAQQWGTEEERITFERAKYYAEMQKSYEVFMQWVDDACGEDAKEVRSTIEAIRQKTAHEVYELALIGELDQEHIKNVLSRVINRPVTELKFVSLSTIMDDLWWVKEGRDNKRIILECWQGATQNKVGKVWSALEARVTNRLGHVIHEIETGLHDLIGNQLSSKLYALALGGNIIDGHQIWSKIPIATAPNLSEFDRKVVMGYAGQHYISGYSGELAYSYVVLMKLRKYEKARILRDLILLHLVCLPLGELCMDEHSPSWNLRKEDVGSGIWVIGVQ